MTSSIYQPDSRPETEVRCIRNQLLSTKETLAVSHVKTSHTSCSPGVSKCSQVKSTSKAPFNKVYPKDQSATPSPPRWADPNHCLMKQKQKQNAHSNPKQPAKQHMQTYIIPPLDPET